MTTARDLREATRHLLLAHGALDDARRPCGTPLPMPHAYALIELLRAGPLTVTALAQRLSIDRTNVSRLCARLEGLGELERERHPEDGRAWLVRLTRRGEQTARALDDSSVEHFERVLACVGAEADHVVAALTVLADALERSKRASASRNEGQS
jgi:DNA-binding MarR family transcriptional regulator